MHKWIYELDIWIYVASQSPQWYFLSCSINLSFQLISNLPNIQRCWEKYLNSQVFDVISRWTAKTASGGTKPRKTKSASIELTIFSFLFVTQYLLNLFRICKKFNKKKILRLHPFRSIKGFGKIFSDMKTFVRIWFSALSVIESIDRVSPRTHRLSLSSPILMFDAGAFGIYF